MTLNTLNNLILYLGRQLIHYYLCSGVDPSEHSDFPPKVNTPMIGILVVSVLLQTAVQMKIFLAKRKTNTEQISNTPNLKMHFYHEFLKHSLSDFATNILGVSIGVGTIFLVTYINKFNPAELNIYPNYYYVYGFQMYVPTIFSSFICFSFYFQNKPMRICIMEEVKEKLASYDLL